MSDSPFMICYSTKVFFFGEQMKKDEMGRTCGTHEGENKCIRSLGEEA
jgi:hypothetical protein